MGKTYLSFWRSFGVFFILVLVILLTGCNLADIAGPSETTTTVHATTTTTTSTSASSSTSTSTSTTSTTHTGTHGLNVIFFLHQSTGQGLINNYDTNTPIMRGTIESYNLAHGTNFKLWDYWGTGDGGLIDYNGIPTDYNIYSPYDYSQTDPESLYLLWTGADATWETIRTRIMSSFEVIAFKSCFSQNVIQDNDELQQRKEWYLGMRGFFEQHPEKLFVVISLPTQVPLTTTATSATYARDFANWLKSSTYLSGHSNVVCFDLFDYLASPIGSPEANMLRPEYRRPEAYSTIEPDAHPNTLANVTIGPIFAQFLIDAALNY